MLNRLAESLNSSENADVSRLPKYVRLSNVISRLIDSGELRPGDRLPSEIEMAEILPASLGTVQKALSTLTRQGVIVREHGRGTFVAGPRSQLREVWHFRFLDDDGKTVLPVFTKSLAVERVDRRGPWSDFLGADEFYVRIVRLIDINHEFNAISQFYVGGGRFGALLDTPAGTLDGIHIRDVLKNRFQTPTLRVGEQVGCGMMPADVCRVLGLPIGTTGMVCHVLGYTYRDTPVTFQLVYIPPNARRLEIRERML